MRSRASLSLLRVALIAAATLLACTDDAGSDDRDSDSDSDTDTDPRCVAPAGLGAPQSIAEAVDLVNALPEPVTVDCIIASLDRPLYVFATTSKFSAQISPQIRSPRIFIFSGALTMSIALDQPGLPLLEFGESDGNGSSLKGELIAPVSLPADDFLPYEHLRYNQAGTSCGICHRDERLAEDIGHPNAIISRALRPVDEVEVPLDLLRDEQVGCDRISEPGRCALLDALLNHGPVIRQEFDPDLATIFDP